MSNRRKSDSFTLLRAPDGEAFFSTGAITISQLSKRAHLQKAFLMMDEPTAIAGKATDHGQLIPSVRMSRIISNSEIQYIPCHGVHRLQKISQEFRRGLETLDFDSGTICERAFFENFNNVLDRDNAFIASRTVLPENDKSPLNVFGRVSMREVQILKTLARWLGTNIGGCFLRETLLEVEKASKKPANVRALESHRDTLESARSFVTVDLPDAPQILVSSFAERTERGVDAQYLSHVEPPYNPRNPRQSSRPTSAIFARAWIAESDYKHLAPGNISLGDDALMCTFFDWLGTPEGIRFLQKSLRKIHQSVTNELLKKDIKKELEILNSIG